MVKTERVVRALGGVLLVSFVSLAVPSPGFAEGGVETPAVVNAPDTQAVAPGGTQAVSEVALDVLEKRVSELDARGRALAAEAAKLDRRARARREQAIGDDRELQALQVDIQRRQKEFEKRVSEKYPDLAKDEEERAKLLAEYASVYSELKSLREKIGLKRGGN